MKKRDEVLVGMFTTAALAVAVLGALWLARGGLSAGYPLYTRFTWGQGLKQGQPVWLSGATVGYVDRITFEQGGTLLVTYRIENQYKVPLGTTATILPNGFFGDVAIGLTPARRLRGSSRANASRRAAQARRARWIRRASAIRSSAAEDLARDQISASP